MWLLLQFIPSRAGMNLSSLDVFFLWFCPEGTCLPPHWWSGVMVVCVCVYVEGGGGGVEGFFSDHYFIFYNFIFHVPLFFLEVSHFLISLLLKACPCLCTQWRVLICFRSVMSALRSSIRLKLHVQSVNDFIPRVSLSHSKQVHDKFRLKCSCPEFFFTLCCCAIYTAQHSVPSFRAITSVFW